MSTPEALDYAVCLDARGYYAEAAELRRQHAEIERLTAERDALKLTVERLQQHNTTTWNAGHTLGVMAGQKALTQAQDALKRDAWGNTQLTEALLSAEAERDALREAGRLTLAWFDAENDHAGTTFWERVEMCRAAEDALRAALAQGKEPSNG